MIEVLSLDDYFCRTDDTPAALSKRSGVHQKTIEKLRRTGSVPNGNIMKRLYVASSGMITPFVFWGIRPIIRSASENA